MCLLDLCLNGDLEGVKAALKSGADVDTSDEDGFTGLMWAISNQSRWARAGRSEAECKNFSSVIALLLRAPNIDVNLKSEFGWCALFEAVSMCNNEALMLLLRHPNIDANILDCDGGNALHTAVFSDNIEGLKLLLDDPNINVNLVDNKGESVVHWAMRKNSIEGLKLLLDVPNIDVNIVDNDGVSAVHWAMSKNYNIKGLKLLLKHRGLTALTLNHKDKDKGATPVMWAVRKKRLEVLALLAADPRVDLDTTDKEGRSLEDIARWVLLLLHSQSCHNSRQINDKLLI